MKDRSSKRLLGPAIALAVVLVAGVLTMVDAVNLPGNWRETLGFAEETPNPPCRLGLYRNSPKSPAPGPGSWRFEPEVRHIQVETSGIAIGPTIYVVGGTKPGNLHRFQAYDTRTKRWSEPTRTPIGINHSQVATYDGKLYFAGGYFDGDEPTDEFWQYDPKTDRWTELPPMHQARAAGATVVIGHKLYVAAGAPQTFYVSSPVSPYGTLEIYDFDTGRWTFGSPMPVPRHHISGVAVGGKLYAGGGRGEADHSLDVFERYDPGADRWERLPDLPFGVASPTLVAAAGKIVVIGGEDQLNWEDGDGWVTPSAWAFDPKSERWQRLPDMHVERRGGGAGVAGGRIYAISGSYCPGLKPNGPVGTYTVESLPISALSRDEELPPGE